MGDGEKIQVRGRIGESLLDLARREDIDLEGMLVHQPRLACVAVAIVFCVLYLEILQASRFARVHSQALARARSHVPRAT